MITTDPEAAFVGAVLNLDLTGTRLALALVDEDLIGDHKLRCIVRAAVQLVAAGVVPDPAAVLASMRADGSVHGPDAVQELSLLLLDLYAGCPTPASAPVYAVAVLDEAVRRRCTELAARIGQAAEAEGLESLVALVDNEVQAVRALVARRQTMGAPAPRLRAVGA